MKYIVRKIITMIVTVVIVSLLVFLAFQVIPGDPAVSMLGTSATQVRLEKLREQLGINRPLYVRYFSWLADFFFGDMGKSYSYGSSVKAMIGNKIPITLTLSLMAFIFIVVFSIPIGIYIAKHEDKWFSHAIDVINQIFMSVPPFFIGILLTYFCGLILRIFTPGGYVSYETSVIRFVGYLIFPALAIAIPKVAMNIKLIKSSLLKESKLDYVRTAYSRGNSTNDVLYKHVLKNAMIPVVTFLGMTLSDIVAGSLIVEQVFSIPGMGRMLITSISNRDYPVVQAIIAIIAFIVIIVNFVVDIIYKVIDPRMR